MKLTITKDSDEQLALRFPFDRLIIEAIKGVPGHRWSPERQLWLIPNRRSRLSELLALLGETGLFPGSTVEVDPYAVSLPLELEFERQQETPDRPEPADPARIALPSAHMAESEGRAHRVLLGHPPSCDLAMAGTGHMPATGESPPPSRGGMDNPTRALFALPDSPSPADQGTRTSSLVARYTAGLEARHYSDRTRESATTRPTAAWRT